MSFGWSAGDIAQAITLIVKVVKALDSADGAAGGYREAVAFLQGLKHTLEPLQTFTALGAYPAYKDEIQKHVESIREPIESFLVSAAKFDHSLGPNAKSGHHRHISSKLQWWFVESKAMDKLRNKIDRHLKVLETLLQRLTLDMVWTVQNNLRGELRIAFTDLFNSQLIGALRSQLQPLELGVTDVLKAQDSHARAMRSEIQLCHGAIQELRTSNPASKQFSDQQIKVIMSKLEGQDLNLKAIYEAIKQQTSASIHKFNAQHQLTLSEGSKTVSVLHSEDSGPNALMKSRLPGPICKRLCRESLRDVYYLVLLALAHFLRNLFLYLSTKVQPSRALMPKLLAKYNISFYDAIGRPPRVLDYQCFVSYRVFQAFLHDSFSDRPGSSWVERGLYRLYNARNGQAITHRTWSKMASPGSHIHMSMLIEQDTPDKKNNDERCPARHCNGVLRGGQCSECEMEVLNFRFESLASSEPDVPEPSSNATPEAIRNEELEEKNLKEVVLSDMVYFKRVVRRPPKIKILPAASSLVPSSKYSTNATTESQTNPSSGSGASPSVEIFKSFRVSMNDPCYKVLPAALKKYNINEPWHHYALYIVFGDLKQCLGPEEKPLILFKQLDKEGKKPMFMLRKISPSDITNAPPTNAPPTTSLGWNADDCKLETFRVAMEDPCSNALPATHRKYTLTSPWQTYDLYIVFGDAERCLGLKEMPLLIFKILDWEGKKPRFELRKKKVPGISLETEIIRIEKQNLFPGIADESFPHCADDKSNTITDRQLSSNLENGRPIWNCHRCAEVKLDSFMDGCPTCFHLRCKRCPAEWLTGKSSTSNGASKRWTWTIPSESYRPSITLRENTTNYRTQQQYDSIFED